MPFLLKNIGSMWQGTPLTNGHPYMQDFVCDYDTEMVAKIKAAGFLLLGRTNTPEGGWSIGTEPRLYGPTRNPWNSGLTPGGSSGGAAAAVASAHGAAGRGIRRRRLDPRAGVVLRAGRAQALAGAHHLRAAGAGLLAGQRLDLLRDAHGARYRSLSRRGRRSAAG